MSSDESALDLDAYFARIGYTGSRAPTLETLRGLHFAHATSIPFENLEVLAGKTPSLDLAAVQQKHVGAKRGGYCFELNALFSAVLKALGFHVTDLIGRVRWKAPLDAVTARSHRLIRVELPEGVFLADIAFGGLTMTGPLRLETHIEQQTPHEVYRLLPHGVSGKDFELQARLGADWATIYSFTLEPQAPVDYEVSNWYTATHPGSIFVQHLIVARPAADRRHALLNTGLTIRHKDGRVETKRLESIDEIAEALRDYFGIALSEEQKAASLAPHFKRWQAFSG
ncbi:MAG: arylamine N-acetyltransferase [Parvibaculum sp.]|uniref:arylamine N-acetyltransferase family protein n=1 Tax=Parvibaculum sp. TaxID=2024848 RepID=UPI0025F2D572|nr:arylamine N-acetyltransferase [Parvibaculum sp.]MCE9648395.1 arylamine N-acetyltransferase [Parvibaculum sp.]